MTLTMTVLALVVIFLIVYDIIIAITDGLDATISWVSYELAQKHPIIPFAIGVVMGHIFWVQHATCVVP